MSNDEDNPIADAIFSIAQALQRLGTGNAETDGWGAIEAHSKIVETASETITGGLMAISQSLDDVAEAIRETKQAPPPPD